MTALATLEFSVGPVARVSSPSKSSEDEEKKKEAAKEGAARWVLIGHFWEF
jgi:hypothetical protein